MLHKPFLFIGGPICYASCLAAVGVGGFIAGAAIRPLLEFTSIVIAGGLWTAALMASYGGAIPAGSHFAQFQAVGAAGVLRSAFGSISGFGSA